MLQLLLPFIAGHLMRPLIRGFIERNKKILTPVDRTSILLVEQNAALALSIADMAYLMETGKIVLSGPAADIRKDESVRRAYLGY